MLNRLLIIHGGGPTCVLNASTYGVIREAQKHPEKIGGVFGCMGGVGGLLNRNFRRLDSLAQEKLERQLAVLAPDQALLTSWCYAASPLSDWANYDFSLFSSCAAHALHLWEQSPSVRALPEQLFPATVSVLHRHP